MNYQFEFRLNSLTAEKTTGEGHDEIYLTGFGMDELGVITIIPIRRIKSLLVDSFKDDKTVSFDDIRGGSLLLSAKLKDRRHLKYQVWLWIIESDDAELLRRDFNFGPLPNEASDPNFIRELRRVGYPLPTIYFQQMANDIPSIHGNIIRSLYKHDWKFEVFNPVTEFVDCNKFVVNPSDTMLVDFKPGEYNIGESIDAVFFHLNNSSDFENEARYTLYHDMKLIVSGTPDLPEVSR
jgi:hypothetical protein